MTADSRNLDHHEINKFSQPVSVWWDPEGDFKTLHDINPLRLEYIARRCSLQQSKVLDVGCGGGILSEALATQARHVTGIDMNETAIEAARVHNSYANLEYACTGSNEHAKKHHGEYDVLTCMELLEHVPEPASLIADCADLVTPDGHLFFSTINRNLLAYLKVVVAAEYVLRMLPKGTHDYGKFIRPAEIARWCRQSGLQVVNINGFDYSPLAKKYTLTDTPAANYLLHAIKPAI